MNSNYIKTKKRVQNRIKNWIVTCNTSRSFYMKRQKALKLLESEIAVIRYLHNGECAINDINSSTLELLSAFFIDADYIRTVYNVK